MTPMNEPQLKPCPFCGATADIDEWDHESQCCVVCRFCESKGPEESTPAGAVEMWNMRPKEWELAQNRTPASPWLPIATAPRDGNAVDIWSQSRGRLTAEWFAYSEDVGGGCWLVGRNDYCTDATHWMPIPAAPGKESQ